MRLFLLFLLLPLVQCVQIPTLKIVNGNILNVPLRGINWFGFENSQTSVDGLWSGNLAGATDFNTIIYKLNLLGFNAVRLPFTFNDMKLPTLKKTIPCKSQSPSDVQKSIIDPIQKTTTVKPFPPRLPLPKSNVCNKYLDRYQNTLDRFVFTISSFIAAGIYVVLDYHPMKKELYTSNQKEYTTKWVSLMKFIKNHHNYNNMKGRIIIDLLNEPDHVQMSWNTATKLYIPTLDSLHVLLGPEQLYMVEGTGQIGYNLNWGDGFVTNPSIVKSYHISDATPFFESILKKPYVNNVIISPHMYGPSISRNARAHRNPILKERMYHSFVYLYSKGYCLKSGKVPKCKKFPIVIGEFGSMFKTKEDLEHLSAFQINMNSMFQDKMSWMYWSYNANSGDTGGIVTNDWYTFEWNKLIWLQRYMYLKPWYKTS